MSVVDRILSVFFTACLAGMFLFGAHDAVAARTSGLRIGVTLHPYYSFVKNIVGDRAEVVPLISEGFNPHNYRPQPEDIKRCMTLDVLVVNGIGHDEFAFEILEAAGMKDTLPVVSANKDVALIPVAGRGDGKRVVNPHTFVSVTAAVQQVYTIAAALEKIDPPNAAYYRKNARSYAKKLRKMKAEYMRRIAELPDVDLRCATIHGGYDYLFQDFGLHVAAVIEPGHGLKPTATQLAEVIQDIKRIGVDVIFTEMDFPDKYVETIHEETGVKIRHLSHLTGGKYSAENFEQGIRADLDALTAALIDARGMHAQSTDN